MAERDLKLHELVHGLYLVHELFEIVTTQTDVLDKYPELKVKVEELSYQIYHMYNMVNSIDLEE